MLNRFLPLAALDYEPVYDNNGQLISVELDSRSGFRPTRVKDLKDGFHTVSNALRGDASRAPSWVELKSLPSEGRPHRTTHTSE